MTKRKNDETPKSIQMYNLEFTLPLYNFPIYVYFPSIDDQDDISLTNIMNSEFIDKWGFRLENSVDDCKGFFTQVFDEHNNQCFVICIASNKGKIDISTLAHEVSHCAVAMKQYIGVETVDEYDEFTAYLIGAIIHEILSKTETQTEIQLNIGAAEKEKPEKKSTAKRKTKKKTKKTVSKDNE